MNCKQVAALLPLYVSGDLDQRREPLVAAHVQTCADCQNSAAEFRETRQLLQYFRPPTFNEGVYDEIRSGVWRELEGKAAAPSISEVLAGWFTPRLAWGAATAALIVVAVFAIYFIANRNTARNLAAKSPEVNRNLPKDENDARTPRDRSTSSAAASPDESKGQRQADIRVTERRVRRKPAPARVDSLVANVRQAQPAREASPSLDSATETDSESAGNPETILRMELQTSNPNVRIIWLSHPETKRSPNSKGI